MKYSESGNAKFKGEFKEGLMEGKGVEYYSSGVIRYEGFFRQGS